MAAVRVEPKEDDKAPEQARAPRAVELVADGRAPVPEKVLETPEDGQAQLEGSRVETEAMVNQDDTWFFFQPS